MKKRLPNKKEIARITRFLKSKMGVAFIKKHGKIAQEKADRLFTPKNLTFEDLHTPYDI